MWARLELRRGSRSFPATSFSQKVPEKGPPHAASIPVRPFLYEVLAWRWQQHALGGSGRQLSFCTGCLAALSGRVCTASALGLVQLSFLMPTMDIVIDCRDNQKAIKITRLSKCFLLSSAFHCEPLQGEQLLHEVSCGAAPAMMKCHVMGFYVVAICMAFEAATAPQTMEIVGACQVNPVPLAGQLRNLFVQSLPRKNHGHYRFGGWRGAQ